ncbi:GGDEF domain-containing protein [Vibrio sinaloensis]|nr:GGDEF domain-containing protein [Vibrio sinaloensis]
MSAQTLRIKRYPTSEQASLAILDIDHFKRVNDKFGHDKGDQVIRAVAVVLGEHLRETDVIARIGGAKNLPLLCRIPHSMKQRSWSTAYVQRFILKVSSASQLALA